LAAYGGNPIPHYRQNGKVILYALPAPAQKHDIAVLSVNPLKTVVGQGYTMQTNVTVTNQGDFTETFNVTLYAKTTTIETKQVTLISGASAALTFTWNTIGFAYGNYTIWAYAYPIQGETDTADNNMTSTIQVHVGVPGDVSGKISGKYDGLVNMYDIVYVINLFLTTPNSHNWNPNADINNDGMVNMKDIYIPINNFLKKEV